MKTFVAFLGLLLTIVTAAPTACLGSGPTATIRNGTYVGIKNGAYNQDFFLGIPYAQQPVGNLRFTVPQPLNESWEGERDAKEYSDICVGYGVRKQILSVVDGTRCTCRVWLKPQTVTSPTPSGILCPNRV
jgi:cholinesterase